MKLLEISTFISYFAIIIIITLFSYHKQKSDTDFVIGDRSLNFWLTALAAHASDMSNWLFMAYPAMIFTKGIFQIWVAIGLTLFMYINWQFIAPKLRTITEKTNSLTINAYFENRFKDTSGAIRTFTALLALIFYVIYISAGLVGMGFLVESLFGLNYVVGISAGLLIVVFYVFIGGYTTVAWIDLFQGFFLLAVIATIPILLLPKIGGFFAVSQAITSHHLTTSIFPDFSTKTFLEIFLITCGWGLGYLGQPHILTKFMGIKHVKDMKKAKFLGISWQVLALTSATIIGLIGIVLFPDGLSNPELIVLKTVKVSFIPFFAAIVLCAMLAATTNVMAAQILVVASSIGEDFYKRFFNKKASHKKVLRFSRLSVVMLGIIAYIIAFYKISTIYELVLYAWSGIGSTFGPLMIISLYSKTINKAGALAGIITGGITAGIWPAINNYLSINIPPIIIGFILSIIAIYLFSYLARKKILNPIN